MTVMQVTASKSIRVILSDRVEENLEGIFDELDITQSSDVECTLDQQRHPESPCTLQAIDKEDQRNDGNLYELTIPLAGGGGALGFWCAVKAPDSREPTRLVAISVFRSPPRAMSQHCILVDPRWGYGKSELAFEEIKSLPTKQSIRDQGDELIGKWGIYLDIQERAAKRREWKSRYSGFRIVDDGSRGRFRVVAPSLPGAAWDSLEKVRVVLLGDSKKGQAAARFYPDVVKVKRNRDEIKLELQRPRDLKEIPKSGVIELKDDATDCKRQRSCIERLVAGDVGVECLKDFLFSDESVDSLQPYTGLGSKLQDLGYLEPRINPEQRRAVALGLDTPDVALIQGPPGTGKTTVIAELCYQYARMGKRVLVAAQTNLAVDNALSKLGTAPEVLAVRLAGRNIKFEDEALDFIGENAVRRWLRGHVAKAKNRLEGLRVLLDLPQQLKEARGANGSKWLDRNISNENIDQAALFEADHWEVSEPGIDETDHLQHAVFGFKGVWMAILEKHGLVQECMPSSMHRLKNLIAGRPGALKDAESALVSAQERLDCRLKLDAHLERENELAGRRESARNDLARLSDLVEGSGQGVFGLLQLTELIEELGHQIPLLRDVGKACRVAKRVLDETSLSRIESSTRKLPSIADHAPIIESSARSVCSWERWIRVPIIGTLARWRFQSNLARLAGYMRQGCWLAGLVQEEMAPAIEQRQVELAACIAEQSAWSKRKKELETDAGRISTSAAKGLVTKARERHEEVQRSIVATDVLKAWMSMVKGKEKMIRARARLVKMAATCRAAGSIRGRLKSLGLQSPRNEEEEKRIRSKMIVIESWIKACQENREISSSMQSRFDSQVNVVGATCSHAASRDFKARFSSFDCVIIDEVSKATPTELLVPSVLGKRVILVGDHKQLPPVLLEDRTFDEEAEELGQDAKRLLEELKGCMFKQRYEEFEAAGDPRIVMLRDQYRMHPDIMDGVNQFYGGQLRIGLPDMHLHRPHHLEQVAWIGDPNVHVVWVDVPKEDRYLAKRAGTSLVNPGQAAVCRDILSAMLRVDNGRVKAKDIGIIMPYRAQWKEYRGMSGNRALPEAVRCSSIDRFQGMEREVIILDLVHNHPSRRPSRFLDQHERINVAMSRARSLLVIVGSYASFIKTYGNDNPYRAFYDVARRKGAIRSVEDIHAYD